MKKYLALISSSIQEYFTYRVSFINNILSIFVQYLVLFYVWEKVYTNSNVMHYSWREMKLYLLVSLFCNFQLNENWVVQQLKTGNIAMQLLRPASFCSIFLSISIGWAICEVLGMVVIGISFIYIFDIDFAQLSLSSLVYFIFSWMMSFLTLFLIIHIACLFALRTNSYLGISWVRINVVKFFSGALIPIVLFPDWLGSISRWLPFSGIVTIPAELFIRTADFVKALQLLLFQLIWVIALWMLSKVLWSVNMERISIQGG